MNRMMRIASAVFVLQVLCGGAAVTNAGEIAPDKINYEDFAVSASLSGKAGDPVEGENVFKNRKLGNCLACHQNSAMQSELFHGTVGPSIDGVADRWEPEQLRAIVADAKQIFGEQTVMPGFYSVNVGENVRKDLVGQPILTAQQVEDVVAYLATLKE